MERLESRTDHGQLSSFFRDIWLDVICLMANGDRRAKKIKNQIQTAASKTVWAKGVGGPSSSIILTFFMRRGHTAHARIDRETQPRCMRPGT